MYANNCVFSFLVIGADMNMKLFFVLLQVLCLVFLVHGQDNPSLGCNFDIMNKEGESLLIIYGS